MGKVHERTQCTQDWCLEHRLVLEQAAIAVGAQRLEQAEEHEHAQAVTEGAHRQGAELLHAVGIFAQQLVAQFGRIVGARLPQERCHVVIDGTLVAALEIDVPRLVVAYHHVARLEVTVEEAPRLALRRAVEQRPAQAVEVGLQLQLVHRVARRLEEAVLEVVQVPADGGLAETGFAEGIVLEVEALHGQELESWQVAHHPVEQLLHLCA